MNFGVGWGKRQFLIKLFNPVPSLFETQTLFLLGLMPDGNALVFIDNHDNQRGHGGGGDLLTFRESKLYKVLHV